MSKVGPHNITKLGDVIAIIIGVAFFIFIIYIAVMGAYE